MSKLITHWIAGRPAEEPPARTGDVYDPATGQVQAKVAMADAAVVDRAVGAAKEAFGSWRRSALSTRTRVLFAYRELLERHADDLIRLVSSEHGKVRPDAEGELRRAIDVVEFACGIPHLLKGEFSEGVSTGVNTTSVRQPVGVVAGITPFNFPLMVPAWMFPIAIACGNTFVLKPSERDPSASIVLAELWQQAGLPDGVFNVVQGDREAVEALLAHPDVAAVSSVGSTPVARFIYETASRNGKRVQALGGAKNHMVVLPDADLDFAADQAVSSGYGSTGQRCMAISAVVAVGAAADPLIEKVRDRLASLKVGPGDDPSAEMGPLVTAESRDRVVSYVEQGLRQGADLVVDGRDAKVEGYEDGFFVGPCLFDRVTPEMSIYTDEIFGPVLVVVRADSLGEAIDLINANAYGNGVAIFTSDGGAAARFQQDIEVGMVGVNVPIPVPMAYHSFGGWKASLFGDLHVHGPEGVKFYTRTKVVTSRWPETASRGVDLGFPSDKR
jgi:malonate-semialdehyde dehydrogenase (acetylating)/methylmalonate-semialdehyde dehydrogenase